MIVSNCILFPRKRIIAIFWIDEQLRLLQVLAGGKHSLLLLVPGHDVPSSPIAYIYRTFRPTLLQRVRGWWETRFGEGGSGKNLICLAANVTRTSQHATTSLWFASFPRC